MRPHLHPRSTATSTLFAGTLLASFVVVAIPHLVPCPHPRGKGHFDTEIRLDENGKPIRRGRKSIRKAEAETETETETKTKTKQAGSMQMQKSLQDEAAMFKKLQEEAKVLKTESQDRECPVPKPRGALGRLLGFQEGHKSVDENK